MSKTKIAVVAAVVVAGGAWWLLPHEKGDAYKSACHDLVTFNADLSKLGGGATEAMVRGDWDRVVADLAPLDDGQKFKAAVMKVNGQQSIGYLDIRLLQQDHCGAYYDTP